MKMYFVIAKYFPQLPNFAGVGRGGWRVVDCSTEIHLPPKFKCNVLRTTFDKELYLHFTSAYKLRRGAFCNPRKSLKQFQHAKRCEIQMLPEGVWEENGEYFTYCCQCSNKTLIDFDISEIMNLEIYDDHYCGRSPRCCP